MRIARKPQERLEDFFDFFVMMEMSVVQGSEDVPSGVIVRCHGKPDFLALEQGQSRWGGRFQAGGDTEDFFVLLKFPQAKAVGTLCPQACGNNLSAVMVVSKPA